MTSRRDFVAGCGSAALLGACTPRSGRTVNDISQLEATEVAGVVRVGEQADLLDALARHSGPICVAGGRFSMGGQTSAAQALQLDLSSYAGVVFLDVARKVVRVRAGTRWRDLQARLDPHDLSVKVMQSFSNFTVGGSVSVNCHGRYVGSGSLASTVRALQVVLRSGEVLETSRLSHPDLFAAVLGGYGLLGVVTEVELDLADNVRMARCTETISLEDYPVWFRRTVRDDPDAIMHNADLMPPRFDAPLAITWYRSNAAMTDTTRLVPEGGRYATEQNMIWAMSELPGGVQLRQQLVVEAQLKQPRVVHRNLEASLDVAALEPRTRAMSTYLLQEYFIPVEHFQMFARFMARILQAHHANALNISIRHAPADHVALMPWAKQEVFCFVLYHKQRRLPWADDRAAEWTRALIDAALLCGGRYYLPYRPHATVDQFQRAYPEASRLVDCKRTYDPKLQLVNHLWERYMSGLAGIPSGRT